eukprot:COSAG06_NODE_82_length_25183_cov_133.214240_7_plen_155_part_00
MGIQNFHGTNPLSFEKGILGPITLGSTNLTVAGDAGWSHRPFLSGQVQHAADPRSGSSTVQWTKLASPLAAKTRPLTWLKASFQAPAATKNRVLKLDALGLSRGHFYVNGHDLGRYYTIGIGADPESSSEMTQRYYCESEPVSVCTASFLLIHY